MATKNQTRLSFGRVKVEVDFIANFPQRVRINEKNDMNGDTKFK